MPRRKTASAVAVSRFRWQVGDIRAGGEVGVAAAAEACAGVSGRTAKRNGAGPRIGAGERV